MTIDYKALAERVERLGNAYEHLADAAYIVEEVLGRWASATGGNTTEIRMAVSLLKGMAQEKPVGYVAANGLRMLKQEDATVLLYAHNYLIRPDCIALYAHPHPEPQLSDTGFTLDQLADACMAAEIPDSKYESLCIALAEERKAGVLRAALAAKQPEPTAAQIVAEDRFPDEQAEPKREPLSDERIDKIGEPFGYFQYGDAQGDKRRAFVRAIEHAHGIGGSDAE